MCSSKKTANGAGCYALHKIYHGIFCFQTVTRFDGTYLNVFPCTPVRKCGLPWADFHETRKNSTELCVDFYTGFHPNRKINVETTDSNSFTLLSKVWLPLHQSEGNKQLLNELLWTPPLPNFIKIRQKFTKYSKLSLVPLLNFGFSLDRFLRHSQVSWRHYMKISYTEFHIN